MFGILAIGYAEHDGMQGSVRRHSRVAHDHGYAEQPRTLDNPRLTPVSSFDREGRVREMAHRSSLKNQIAHDLWLLEHAMYRDAVEDEVMTPVPPGGDEYAVFEQMRWLVAALFSIPESVFRVEANADPRPGVAPSNVHHFVVVPLAQWRRRFEDGFLQATPRPFDEAVFDESVRPLDDDALRRRGVLHRGLEVVAGRPLGVVEPHIDADYADDDGTADEEPLARVSERRERDIEDFADAVGVTIPRVSRVKGRRPADISAFDRAAAEAFARQGFDVVLSPTAYGLPRFQVFWPGSTCERCARQPKACGASPEGPRTGRPGAGPARRVDRSVEARGRGRKRPEDRS